MTRDLVATMLTTCEQNVVATKLKLINTYLLRDKYKIPKHITVKNYLYKRSYKNFLEIYKAGPDGHS